MSNSRKTSGEAEETVHGTISQGLVDFFASQADVMLAQYENINQLLGPTDDWTHPGTHCELLLRDFLRRHFLQGMSADKGYLFGRVRSGQCDQHGPEIDILIHDTANYRPVYRLDDFVIVQPEAVLGMIQVKRTFRAGTDGALAKGVRQIIRARQHLLDVIVQARVRKMASHYGGDLSKIRQYPDFSELRSVYSAVVGFEDETDRNADTYRSLLLEEYRSSRAYAYKECEYDTSVYVLPHFIGTLKRLVLCCQGSCISERQYYAFESVPGGKNVAAQLLLACLTDSAFAHGTQHPPFAFPKELEIKAIVQVPRPDESLHKRG